MSAFTVRLNSSEHAKIRVLAAFQDKSLNEVVTKAVNSYLSAWEDKHGAIPLPPNESD